MQFLKFSKKKKISQKQKSMRLGRIINKHIPKIHIFMYRKSGRNVDETRLFFNLKKIYRRLIYRLNMEVGCLYQVQFQQPITQNYISICLLIKKTDNCDPIFGL